MEKLISKKKIIMKSLESTFISDVLKTLPGTEKRSDAVDLFVTLFEVNAKKVFEEYYTNKEVTIRARITSSGTNRMGNIPGKLESLISLLASDDVLQFDFIVDGRTLLVLNSWTCREFDGSSRALMDIYFVDKKNEKLFLILNEVTKII